MKIFNKYIIASAITVAGLFSCNTDVTVDDFNNGEADFSNYIALGDSLSAGVADGTLYTSAQENSFPAILARQFAQVGGGSFTQPMIEDENGGLLVGGQVAVQPKFVFSPAAGAPVRVDATPTTEALSSLAGNGPFNNLGVPSAKASHLLFDGYGSAANLAAGTANPYYVHFANQGTSILSQAVSQAPTFYSLWIGGNDVLGYAASGGENDVITPAAEFQTYFGALVDNMSKTGAKGVILNIPAIESIPYFTVVPAQSIPMDASTSELVNSSYNDYNGALAQFAQFGLITEEEVAKRTINFVEGNNTPIIVDDSLTQLQNPATGELIPNLRHMSTDELLTLPAASVLGKLADPNNPSSLIGIGVPLGGEYVLDATEIETIQTGVSQLNQVIDNVARAYSVPVFNFNDYLSKAQDTGIKYEGATATVEFVTGGVFSLDGIHATQKGNAIIANKVIETINSSYGANVPIVNVKDYPGVILP